MWLEPSASMMSHSLGFLPSSLFLLSSHFLASCFSISIADFSTSVFPLNGSVSKDLLNVATLYYYSILHPSNSIGSPISVIIYMPASPTSIPPVQITLLGSIPVYSGAHWTSAGPDTKSPLSPLLPSPTHLCCCVTALSNCTKQKLRNKLGFFSLIHVPAIKWIMKNLMSTS